MTPLPPQFHVSQQINSHHLVQLTNKLLFTFIDNPFYVTFNPLNILVAHPFLLFNVHCVWTRLNT
jgi:hypothetical protein